MLLRRAEWDMEDIQCSTIGFVEEASEHLDF